MLTAEQLTEFFNANGMDTPEKLEAVVKPALVAAKVRQLEQQIVAIEEEQSAAMVPFNERIKPIDAERAAAIKPFQMRIAELRTQIATLAVEL